MSRKRSERRLHRIAALAGTFTGALVTASLALAGFSSGSTATHTVQTKRIFSGSRTAAAHKLTDVSSGSSVLKDDNISYADALIDLTGAWATTFSTTRYLKFSFNNPLPAGVGVSSVTFDFRMLPSRSQDTACYYFEVRRISDDSLLGTHYSSASPACTTGATYSTTSTTLSEVTTSDVANDMYVKVFGRNNTSRAMNIDMATVTLLLYGQSMTLFAKAFTDASTGTAVAGVVLGLDVAGDGVTFTNGTNWATTYNTARYLQLSLPVLLPPGSVITSATFNRTWHSSAAGVNVCYYINVYSGATLIGTHGSGSQISCNNSTTVWTNDSTPLAEVTSATDANQLTIRVYEKATANAKSVDDLVSVTLTYYLD
jgi:hypothetical protein